jgi:hypothetical protein
VVRTERVIAFSATAEAITGVALVTMPALVGRALLGADLPPLALVIARCFGVALIALALAVWPDRGRATGAPALRALLLYNASIAACLAWQGAYRHIGGMLLWPAVVLHVAVAALLVLPLLGVQDEA